MITLIPSNMSLIGASLIVYLPTSTMFAMSLNSKMPKTQAIGKSTLTKFWSR